MDIHIPLIHFQGRLFILYGLLFLNPDNFIFSLRTRPTFSTQADDVSFYFFIQSLRKTFFQAEFLSSLSALSTFFSLIPFECSGN